MNQLNQSIQEPMSFVRSAELLNDDNSSAGDDLDRGALIGHSNTEEEERMVREIENYNRRIREHIQKICKFKFVLLLLNISLTQFTYSSVLSNLYLFLNMKPLHWDTDHANTVVLAFACVACLSAVVSGWLSDTRLNQYHVIIFGYIPIVAGIAMFCFISYAQKDFLESDIDRLNSSLIQSVCFKNDAQNSSVFMFSGATNCHLYIYLALGTFAVGYGILLSNLPLFAIQQLKPLEIPTRRFLSWALISAATGNTICIVFVCYVQQNVNFFYGYLLGLSACLVAIFLFVAGRMVYETSDQNHQRIFVLLRVLGYSLSSEARRRRKDLQTRGETPSLLAMAMQKFNGPYDDSLVDSVRLLLHILPVILAFSFYWVLVFQTTSSFVTQGLHMKLLEREEIKPAKGSIKQNTFALPAVWLSLCSTIPVLLLFLLAETVVLPIIRNLRCFPQLTTECRIVIGFLVSSVALVSAGVVEKFRIDKYNECLKSNSQDAQKCIVMQWVGGTAYHATDFSILYQIPQYICVGLSEYFAMNGCFEFTYDEAPPNMKGLLVGIYYISSGLGSFIAAFLSTLAQHFNWYCYSDHYDYCNPNSGKMYNYFWLLASIQLIFLALFYILASTYRSFCNTGETRWRGFLYILQSNS